MIIAGYILIRHRVLEAKLINDVITTTQLDNYNKPIVLSFHFPTKAKEDAEESFKLLDKELNK